MVQAILGKLAFAIALATMAIAFRKRGTSRQRLNSILLAAALLLTTLHFVIRLSPFAETLVAAGALLLAIILATMVLSRILQGEDK